MLYQKRYYGQYILDRLLPRINFKIVKNSNCQVRTSNNADEDEWIIFRFQTTRFFVINLKRAVTLFICIKLGLRKSSNFIHFELEILTFLWGVIQKTRLFGNTRQTLSQLTLDGHFRIFQILDRRYVFRCYQY